jgi:hypothetical protein
MSAFYNVINFLRRAEPAPRAHRDGFSAGVELADRIGSPVKRRRSKTSRRIIIALGLSGLGYATYQDPSMWPKAWSVAAPVASSLIDAAWTTVASPNPPAKLAETALQNASAHATNPNAPKDTAAAPSPMPAAASITSPVALPTPSPAPTGTVTTEASPLPGDTPEPQEPKQSAAEAAKDAAISAMRTPTTDPFQKRAESVGLHPDLSPALLKRLTDTDFKAAATAIRKALTETADNGVLVWPEKPRAEIAMFHVSFVPGAASADCRRYIVAIAKDGWQTTALPVEKCGVKRVVVRKS